MKSSTDIIAASAFAAGRGESQIDLTLRKLKQMRSEIDSEILCLEHTLKTVRDALGRNEFGEKIDNEKESA
jgi:hypothetical protein